MSVELKINDLKHSHVQHGLERLAQFGWRSGIWNRIRFDDEFARSACQAAIDIYKTTPGKRFQAEFDRIYTRLELSELLQQNRVMSLKNNIIQQLLPDTQKTDQPELIGSKYEKEWIVVSPGYRMDEDAIRMELDRRGLIPANTEDGLGFMLTHQRATVENSLVVLDSWREYRGSKEFLALGYTGAGFPMVFMTSNVEADKYLAKAKPLQPAASEPEN